MSDDPTVRNREVWAAVNERFTDADADVRWRDPAIVWGLFRRSESELGVLGAVAGLDVCEVGSGTAFFGAALARAGARVVALDLSYAQLATAARNQVRHHLRFPLVTSDGAHLPLRDASFDLVVSEYGAAPWCEPGAWTREAARVLRPGGRLVFLTNSVLAGLCVPAEGGVAGDRLLRSVDELRHVTWPGGGTEHHPGHGEWIRVLRDAGFVVDALHELRSPPGAVDPDFYDIATPEWAARWPAEDLWVAHRAGPGARAADRP